MLIRPSETLLIEIQLHGFIPYQKGVSELLWLIENLLECVKWKGTILKEINALLIIYFCLEKCSSSVNTFWTNLV